VGKKALPFYSTRISWALYLFQPRSCVGFWAYTDELEAATTLRDLAEQTWHRKLPNPRILVGGEACIIRQSN
jgi:hypothetical protein